MKQQPGQPFSREHPALTEAIRASTLPKGRATDADAVPATKLPTTRAQREAIRLARSNGIVDS